MLALNSRAIFVNLNLSRFLTFFQNDYRFLPSTVQLVFKLNRVTLVVFNEENTIIMTCNEFIVKFNFVEIGSDGWKISEKGIRPGTVKFH